MIRSGLFYLFETLGQISVNKAYRLAVDEAVYGEQLGFDAICPAEHHFGEHYGIMPQVELYLSWVAARTQKILLWPMVIVAPLADPIRLAENVAMLDQYSEGRMVFSVGSGYRGYEFTGWGRDIKNNAKMMREAIDVCVQAWTQEKVDFEGEFFKIHDLHICPQTFQKPHPPVYVTTTRDEQIVWAAERGYGIVPGAGFTPYEISHCYDIHADVAKKAGRNGSLTTKPFFKWIYVDEDDKRAKAVAQDYFIKTVMAFAHGGDYLFKTISKKIQDTWPSDKPLDQYGMEDMDFDKMTDISRTPLAYGDPKRVIDMLKPCVETGVNFFIGGFNMGVMPSEQVKRSMKLYAEKVMPYL
ncbi:MAG: LLM class flavin-dependent oxidoreductase [Nitrospirae bacterium]|nr:LLM class flavin-dependent oxidoreductase [Nitrospirota bacterium]